MIIKKYVFHGCTNFINLANPKRHVRIRKHENGKKQIIFDDISFHASTYKWIALAYIYKVKTFTLNDKDIFYNIGVDLYKNKKEIEVYGFESLKQSLEVLYGSGGYLLQFFSEDFFHTDGLGNLEMITNKALKPISIKYVKQPIQELLKQNVTFKFINLSLPKNEKLRNIKETMSK